MVDINFDLSGIESFEAAVAETAAEWEGQSSSGYRVFTNVDYAFFRSTALGISRGRLTSGPGRTRPAPNSGGSPSVPIA